MVAPGMVTEEEIQNLRQRRIAAEKRVQQLNTALQNLQALYDARAKPNDLVAIRKTGTAIYGKPEEESKPLFIASAKDQFQMIEIKSEWVHVQIAGESRGWIRKSQIEFPDDSYDAQRAVSIRGFPHAHAERGDQQRVSNAERYPQRSPRQSCAKESVHGAVLDSARMAMPSSCFRCIMKWTA